MLVVADDPGMQSSQTEQDTRQYARLAKVPVLEPGDAREALAFVKEAFEISEKYRVPVIVRSTTGVSHSRAMVETGERREARQAEFVKNPPQFVPISLWGRKLRADVEKRIDLQAADAAAHSTLNRIFHGRRREKTRHHLLGTDGAALPRHLPGGGNPQTRLGVAVTG